MSVRNCPSCNRLMNATLAACPWCGAASNPQPEAAAAGTIPCPFCKEPIRPEAVKCRWCGESIGKGGPGAYVPPTPSSSDPLPPPMYRPPAPSGTVPLVFGILGLVFCQLLAPVAWITGANYENQCADMGVEPDGSGRAGKILGIIGTIFLFLGCGCGLLWIMGAASSTRGF